MGRIASGILVCSILLCCAETIGCTDSQQWATEEDLQHSHILIMWHHVAQTLYDRDSEGKHAISLHADALKIHCLQQHSVLLSLCLRYGRSNKVQMNLQLNLLKELFPPSVPGRICLLVIYFCFRKISFIDTLVCIQPTVAEGNRREILQVAPGYLPPSFLRTAQIQQFNDNTSLPPPHIHPDYYLSCRW